MDSKTSLTDHPHVTSPQPPGFLPLPAAVPLVATAPPSLPAPEKPEEIKAVTLKELAQKHTELAIKALVAVLEKGESGLPEDRPASDMARIAAATALLDRGHGKPTQFVEQTTKLVTYQDLLTQIEVNEDRYQSIVNAEEVTPLISWDDVL